MADEIRTDPPPPVATKPEEEMLAPAPIEDDQPFSPVDYLVVNGIFMGFVLVLYVAMRAFFPDTGGLTFFFGLIVIGFLAVSIYDFLFDRLYVPPKDERQPGE